MTIRHHTPEPENAIPSDRDAPSLPAESVFVFPATLAQRRFWLLDKLHPGGNPALNMPVPLRLRGKLNVEALRQAWRLVIDRHEALRTAFASDRGELSQIITPRVDVDLPLVDARSVSAAERPALIDRSLREEAQLPFDLEAGPLVRARLVRLDKADHLLLVTAHHIVSDGWSNGLIARELCTAYSAIVQDEEPFWPESRLQFADYADWQHQRLQANDFAWQRKYWQQQLSGDLPVLDLPTDRPRLKSHNATGDLRSRVLPPELVAAAKAFATSEGASPFMLFLAVFQVLLHRYTGQDDFLITTPSANRQRQELEAVVGLFVNPLLLRADLRDDPSFSELLGRVRRIALDGFVNQDVPFELLLDEFQPQHLQVNFLYQSAFFAPVQLPGALSVEPLRYVSPGTVHELSASAFEEGDSVRLEFEYDTALFDAATVERMIDHYQTLLEGALADPGQHISALPFLTPAERSQAGLENAPAVIAPSLDVRAPLVARVMEKTDAMTARHGKRELSCAELLARMEIARNAHPGVRPPSDLDHGAAWVAYWRARIETPPPAVIARSPEADAVISAGCVALQNFIGVEKGERMTSFSEPGAAATEELGAAILAGALLVYPAPELLAEPIPAIAAWLQREDIAVAFLPAATWNRLGLGRKIPMPAKLRLVIVTEGDISEGSFGRVAPEIQSHDVAGVRVCSRTVIETAGGTIALDGQPFPAATRLRVLDSRSREPLPVGVPGELFIAEDESDPTPVRELARWLPDGSIDRLGPAAAQLFARGFRVDLRRTEAALCALPGVQHALLHPFVVENEPALAAYIFSDGPALPDDATLRQLLREKELPDQSIPSAFIRLKEIPVRLSDGHLDLDAFPPPPTGKAALSEPVRPYLGLQLQLIAIWEDVLGVSGIGIRDNFFDLGGNSLLAIRMLQRAEAACGKMILPAALFSDPTIEHLAGVLAREVIQDSPALLRVHDAGKRTPFFYLHGDLSGGGFYSLKLSRALGPDQPFYVMPPQDVRALSVSPTIEEMATRHLAALRSVRPKGPYVIGGFCAAGLIAYELAQQLRASGEQVEMLVIIDAEPDDRALRAVHSLSLALGRVLRWDDEAKVAHFERWVLRRARYALWGELSYRAQARIVWRRICNRFRSITRFFRQRDQMSESSAEAKAEAISGRDVASVFLWASARYRPKPYDSAVALLLSEDVLCSVDNVAREWKHLAHDMTVHPLIGSHLECITAHVDTLAKTIERCLGNAPEVARLSRQISPPGVTGGFRN